MERQNVTLSLPKALLKRIKAIAVKEDKSLSELLRESLEEKIRESTGYKKAKEKHLRLLRKGLDLGTEGRISIPKDELHDRR